MGYIYTFNYIYNDTRYYWISCIYVEAAPNLRSDQELENHRRTIPPIHIKTQIHRYPSPRNDPYLFWSDSDADTERQRLFRYRDGGRDRDKSRNI